MGQLFPQTIFVDLIETSFKERVIFFLLMVGTAEYSEYSGGFTFQ